MRAAETAFVAEDQERAESVDYRNQLNSEGSPSEIVAAGYRWRPGTELTERGALLAEERLQ
jgi:hypothetical protein